VKGKIRMTKEVPHPPQSKDVVYLSTNIDKSCEVCQFRFNNWYDLGNRIQHYLDHGYKLLHVGSETSHDDEGKPWHSTVAVVGLEDI